MNLITVSGGVLDWEYVRGWMTAHGTAHVLAELRAEAEG